MLEWQSVLVEALWTLILKLRSKGPLPSAKGGTGPKLVTLKLRAMFPACMLHIDIGVFNSPVPHMPRGLGEGFQRFKVVHWALNAGEHGHLALARCWRWYLSAKVRAPEPGGVLANILVSVCNEPRNPTSTTPQGKDTRYPGSSKRYHPRYPPLATTTSTPQRENPNARYIPTSTYRVRHPVNTHLQPQFLK